MVDLLCGRLVKIFNLFFILSCNLCHGRLETTFNIEGFYDCGFCRGIQRDKRFYLSPTEEKKRYEEHNNDVEDLCYQNFVSPITDAVLRDFDKNAVGLDFGAGTGPVISKVLSDNGYSIEKYDPFFCDRAVVLRQQYDFIVCCEVVEHFHRPDREFELLRRMLKPGGRLYCMTHLYSEDVDFKNWYYRNDPTHVFFYRAETFQWIKEYFRFGDLLIAGRLIVLADSSLGGWICR